LNGVDYREWSPEVDPHIKKKYSAANLRGKAECKKDLQVIYGLPPKPGAPLLGIVSRLVHQKGMDQLLAARGPPKAPPLRLVLLGDSTALGVGVDQVSDTVGGQLAALLAEGPGGRRVELSSVAVAGSHSSDLGIQVARALVGPPPDVAVVLIGTNDAVRLARTTEAADQLSGAVKRLCGAGAAVVEF